MSNSEYAFFTDVEQQREDFQAGWEALQSALAEDEQFAQHLFESFHGREY